MFASDSQLPITKGKAPSIQESQHSFAATLRNSLTKSRFVMLLVNLVLLIALLVLAQSRLTNYEEAVSLDRYRDQVLSVPSIVKQKSSGGRTEADLVAEILRLGAADRSFHGKAHRSVICTLTRNDVHLREFVVRNLLAGYSHIVIYDNNQAQKGMDFEIRGLLQPFIDAGAVSHVSWNQNSTESYIQNDAKNGVSRHCYDRYKDMGDWMSLMDTDEVFYVSAGKDGSPQEGLGGLNRLLRDLEERAPDTCAVSFPWRMMYGERLVSKPPGLLMDAYKRVCEITDATKMVFRPEWADLYNIPHFLHCTNHNGVQYRSDAPEFKKLVPEYQSELVHYYQKSIEEWLTKFEQSIPPYLRYLPDSYNHVEGCPAELRLVEYDSTYEHTVRDLMSQFWEASAYEDGGRYLGPPPEFPRGAIENFDLYLFFKLRVSLGDEWDEEAYLIKCPEVAQAVQDKKFVDGLQQFLKDGFAAEMKSCWVRNKSIKFCIESSPNST